MLNASAAITRPLGDKAKTRNLMAAAFVHGRDGRPLAASTMILFEFKYVHEIISCNYRWS
jgi:hypothetical protein